MDRSQPPEARRVRVDNRSDSWAHWLRCDQGRARAEAARGGGGGGGGGLVDDGLVTDWCAGVSGGEEEVEGEPGTRREEGVLDRDAYAA